MVSILSMPSDLFDFNDYVYYRLCKDFSKYNPTTIVSNDKDFAIKDLPILTLLPELYNMKFNSQNT
jgi:hypothetical protein